MDTHARLPERGSASATDDQVDQGPPPRFAVVRGWLGPLGRRLRPLTDGPWRRAAALVAGCLVVVLLVSAFVMQPFLVPSGSMENTLRPGDRILVNKLAYRFGSEPARGDVVVFDGSGTFSAERSPGNPVTAFVRKAAAATGLVAPAGTDYVKRVVGSGGDRVTCCDAAGRITVNGRPLRERTYLYPGDRPSRVRFDVVVPEGELWVMGDHRGDSRDSRDFLGAPGGGMVPVDRVIGRAEWIGWPVGRWSGVDRETGAPGVGAYRGRAGHGG
jgi:signal peptidase I